MILFFIYRDYLSNFIIISSFKNSFVGLFYTAIILYLLSNRKSIFSNILSNQCLIYLGKISYGLYVFHPFCFNLVNINSTGILLYILGGLTATILVSSLSYHFFENRFLVLKEKWAY